MLEQRLGSVRLAKLEIGLGHGAAPILDHQPVLIGKPPEGVLADRDPGAQEPRVVEPRIPKRVLQILAPVEQRLRHRDAIVELPDRADPCDLTPPHHVRPRIKPAGGCGRGVSVLKLAVAGLDLVVQELEAHLLRPPPLPQRNQADPDPVAIDPRSRRSGVSTSS